MPIIIEMELLPETYGIAKLPASSSIPSWMLGRGFFNISSCTDEISIVCPQERIPHSVEADMDWVALKFTGTFEFDECGVVYSVIKPLSKNNIGIFVISTFQRDYLLIKKTDYSKAKDALKGCGHRIEENI